MPETAPVPADDQGDSGPDRERPSPERTEQRSPQVNPEDAHIGATEDEVSDTSAPAGEEYKDEPKQG